MGQIPERGVEAALLRIDAPGAAKMPEGLRRELRELGLL
jgi:hypothetical protein